jgi:hypothetical protein
LLTPLRQRLLEARKRYSTCAKALESKIKASGLSDVLSEQVIGVGVALDWVRRAAEMDDIVFVGDQLNRSEHKPSFVEILRFNFCWFGLNAVFSRPSLLGLFSRQSHSSEFDDFLVLFNGTPLPNALTQVAKLHNLLMKDTSPRMPYLAKGTNVPTLRAIYTKYLRHASTKGKTTRAIAAAVQTGNLTALSLPTLLYAFRNWSVHGAALDGSFGTRPGFIEYVAILQDVIADIHYSTAARLTAII